MQRLISIVASSLMVLALFGVCAAQSAGAAAPLGRITVEAGEHTRVDTPVSVSLAGVALGFPDAEYVLVESKSSRGRDVAAQLEGGSPPRLWFVLSGETKAGTKRTFELLEAARGKARGVSVKKQEDYYEILHSGQKVLRYNHAIVPPPEGQDKLYERSGFIHPLWSPKGTVLTNIHPADHIHHLGIWMPWTHTEFEGKPVDFWNLKAGQGTVRFKRFVSTTDGPVYGGFEAEQEHVVLKTDPDVHREVVLNEVWDVRVYSVGGAKKGYWLWDFKSTQRCVADSPLRQVKYRYGGFGFRGAAEWDEENSVYLTSEGKNRKDGHTTRARWCDTSGEIDGWEGVTFYSHPENFEHPEPMRIWPSGQVFFNFCPSQATDWEMKPGEDHVFRYRLYVHEGKIEVADAERIWQDYAEPPKVTIEAVPAKEAIMLFEGKDLSKHWTAGKDKNDEERKIGWDVEGGVATIAPKSGSIWTKRDFTDFKMHIEFKIPQMPANVKGQGRGNSGVYIQRRYELQILDSYGQPARKNEGGSIYKFRAPDKNVCRPPGRWQSYDIIFRAARYDADKKVEDARITLWHNGVFLVHDDVKVPNKTGAGREEGPDPGPILLQNHGNAVSFRNIWIVPL